MKKKSFFYKFNKDIYIYKSSNHNFFSEDEDRTFNKLVSLLDKKNYLNELISNTFENLNEYYDQRIGIKKELLNKKSYLRKYENYLFKVSQYIITIKFDKILTYSDIDKIYQSLGVEIVRISGYDTVVEVLFNDISTLYDGLNKLIETELIIINSIINDSTDYEDSNRFILSIEDIKLDTINRDKINYINQGNNILVSFSNKYILNDKTEYEILKEIYKKYKTNESVVEIITNEKESLNLTFLFKNINNEFLEDIKILDGLINIEVVDIKEDDILEKINYTPNLPIITENLELINKVCIVDSIIKDNDYFIGTLSYGTIESKIYSPHGTCVGLLAMYGKIPDNLDTLPIPDCSIYNISMINPYSDIEKVINESEKNGSKIINISLGVPGYIKDNDGFSTLAKKIDKLLTNKDILLILSGGNINPPKTSYLNISDEDANINIPKDSISSLVIGAKNDNNLIELYSRKNNIDPEYCIGETKGYMYRFKDKKKPDFIDYGENIVFDGINWNKGHGTSYAAPLIANKAVKILNTYGNISTNTIKALFLNYSNTEKYNKNLYSSKIVYERHIGRGDIDIDNLLSDDNSTLNIIIEDFIGNNEKKEYFLKLPKINQKNIEIGFKRSISYNPPINENYHLKYCKFCVSSQLWSNTYQETRLSLLSDIDNGGLLKWNEWKKDEIYGKYSRPLNWVNYFGNNNFWSTNSFRYNLLNNDLYEELSNGTNIIIEGHSRDNSSHKQKFSFVMTIDITSLADKDGFIDEFYSINSDLLIHGDNITIINDNINIKEQNFINQIDNDLVVEIESF